MAALKAQQDETATRRLDSWKEIAQYLGKDITTVMRYERERGLPVHRVPGNAKRQTVYAIPEEIDDWLSGAGVRESGLAVGEEKTVAGESRLGVGEKQEAHLQERNLATPVPRDGHDSEMPGVKPGATSGQRRTYLGYLVAAGCTVVALSLVYMLVRSAAVPKVLAYHQITNDGRLKDNTIVSDGARVYFTESTPSGWIVAEIAAGGGKVKPLSAFFDHPLLQDLSRTRSEILILDPYGVSRAVPLWAMPLSGGPPRRVGNVVADSAAWAPDGNSVVYSAGHDLFLCLPDGSESRRLASLPGQISGIRWSPDGSLLRIMARRSDRESAQIWEVQANGSNAHALLPSWHSSSSQSSGQWTPDGKYFVFCSRDNSDWDLWSLSEKVGILGRRLSSPVKITTGPLGVAAWSSSPDGNKAFALEVLSRSEVFRFDRGSRQFVLYFRGESADYLDFSPNGQWAAYTDPADWTLWKSRSDGSQALQLTLPGVHVELPRWSPDGNWIAFMGNKRVDEPWKVYVMPAAGGELRPVMLSTSGQGAPTWSPDGKQIAFGDLPEPGRVFLNSVMIHIVDLNSHGASTLPGSSGLYTARWSPDGSHIAAITTDQKTLKIFDFHSGQWQAVATAGCISDLIWSHRGDAVYFMDTLPGPGPAVYRVRVRDGNMEKVVTLTGSRAMNSNWLGLAPDDSILVSNGVGTNEIYALDVEWP